LLSHVESLRKMQMDINPESKDYFSDYENVIPIFKGGQKEVYKANHPFYGEVVLKSGKYSGERSLERIKREVEFLGTINSEYFPKNFLFEVNKSNQTFFIVEEFIEAFKFPDLAEYYNSEKRLISLLKELIYGLRLIWDRNVVHRDLKPDNILITKNYKPKIIDLGIARFIDYESLTKTIQPFGPCTPIYAAPEQLLNKKSDINLRTDFFSLGIIILELYLGFHPFDPKELGNQSSIPENIINGQYIQPSKKPGTSKEFSELLRKLLGVQPYERFRNHQILFKIHRGEFSRMRLYHQVGFREKWNLDSLEEDGAGYGLIISPVNMKLEKLEKISSEIKKKSFFDPQIYLPRVVKGSLSTYGYFPSDGYQR
jgi:serine/threonine protein kinase